MQAAWKQVWVTDRGPIKEKRLVARYPDGGVRFQGELPRPGGLVLLDRTTLTPRRDGSVRQLIEQSDDGGASWVMRFDAVYVRRSESPRPPPGGRSRPRRGRC